MAKTKKLKKFITAIMNSSNSAELVSSPSFMYILDKESKKNKLKSSLFYRDPKKYMKKLKKN